MLPTCNRAKLAAQFLRSVERQTALPYEIIVVDQSDDWSTRDVFDRWDVCGNIIRKKYIHREIKSLILARHVGLDACADTDLVVFFDDDITLDSLFCEEIIKVFEQDPDGKFAGGMGTVKGWGFQPKPFQAFFLMPHEGNGRFLPSGSPTFVHWKNDFCETEFVSGGCTFWRREIIQKYRFDEHLGGYGYGDDVDISYRVSRDYKLFFQPKSVCYQEANPPGRVLKKKYRSDWVKNMYYLARKNNFSIPAYAWCVFGHLVRDLVCFDFKGALGDIEGAWSIVWNGAKT
jgi:GT2 family glycosyltransferase